MTVCLLIMATSHYLPSLQHRCFHTFNVPSSHPPPTGCVRHLSESSLEAVCQLQYKTILPKMDWCLPDVICHLEGMGKYTQEIWLMLSKMCASPSKAKGMLPQVSVHSRLIGGSSGVFGMVETMQGVKLRPALIIL